MVRTDIGPDLVSSTFQIGVTQAVIQNEPERKTVIPIPCRLHAESIEGSHETGLILKFSKPR